MKHYFLSAVALGLLAVSCNNSTSDNVKAADTANNRRSDSLRTVSSVSDSASIPSRQDAAFIVNAASGGMLEIELGQLAQANAASQKVKDFGQMMVQDHGQVAPQIRQLAAAKRIILPDSVSNEQKKERDDLAKKTGSDFDKAYVKLMIADHKEDIDEFKKAAQNANDSDIKVFAGNMLPTLQKHLSSVEAIKK